MLSIASLNPSRLLSGGRRSTDVTSVDLAQMRITGAIEYLAGAIVFLSVVGLPDTDTSDHGAYLALAGIGLMLALLRFWAPQQLWVPRASILIGFVYVAAVVSLSRPLGPTPFFFIWPMLTAAYFLGRRDLAVAAVGFTVTLGAGMALNPDTGNDMQIFNASWSVIVIVSTLVLVLRERVDRLMNDLAVAASTDMLTGLANRRTFESSFDREIERARRSKTPLALAIFDLDHFKEINDRLGHAEGDRALRRFADLMRTECRVVDVPARIGGEEFALIFSNASAEGGRIFAERFIERLALLTRHDPAPLSVSVGITELTDPRDTQDLLLLAADRALYEAKNTGRGKAVVARPVPSSRIEHTGGRLELSNRPALTEVTSAERAAG